MSKQMTRDEWNMWCQKKDPTPCRCELEECVHQEPLESHWIDCIDCEHWVEVQDD